MKTPILLILLVLGSTMATAQLITGYEYWFDGNFSNRTTVAVASTSVLNLQTNITAASLATGLHFIALRVKDDSARFSAPTPAYPFYTKTDNNTVTAYRFWFNDDFSGTTTSLVSASTNVTIPLNIPCNTLPDGVHSFAFQVKDFAGNWSPTVYGLFHKRGGSAASQTFQITAFRYWFDGNLTTATTQNVTASTHFSANLQVNSGTLTDGNHLITWQLQDHTGTWSLPVSASFFKRGNTPNPIIQLTAYRYWFDQTTPQTAQVALPNPAQVAQFTQSIACDTLTKGWHDIFVQVKDQAGIWSTAITDSFYRHAIPVAGFTVQNPTVCVGLDSVHLINQSQEADSVYWTFGDGTNSGIWQPSIVYAQTGQFAISQTAIDKTSGFSNQLSLPNAADVRGLPVSAFAFAVTNRDVQFTNQSVWADNYLWRFGDGDSSTQQNPLHSYSTSGSFQAELEVVGYCGSATSTQTVLLVFGVEESAFENIQVYPNPASEKLRIKVLLRRPATTSLRLISITGQTVWIQQSEGTIMALDEIVDVSNLPVGLYLLHISLPNENHIVKVQVR